MTEEPKDNLPPPKNPDAGKPAKVAPARRKSSKAKTKFAGKDLTADISARSAQGGTSKRYRYWVGVSPSCPVEGIDCAGINFPKVNANLIPDPLRTGRKKRQPVIGAIVWLDEDRIRKMREKLPRTILRFTSDAGEATEPGTGENIGDVARRPRRGQLITIPTDEEIADRKKRGKPTRAYTPNPARDVPASRFMFAVLCEDQENGERGESYPDPLEVTGLVWPDELAAVEDILS